MLPDGKEAEMAAPRRAFALKQQYMRTILAFAQKSGGQGTYNGSALVKGYGPHLMDVAELKEKSFEQILLERFKPFYGLTYKEICAALGIQESNAKHKYAMATNEILTEKRTKGKNVLDSEEFVKSGIRLKSLRVEPDGRIEQHISFEAIDYEELMQEDSWLDSRFYELATSRFLFVTYKKSTAGGTSDYRLDKTFFWTMPPEALEEARKYWENIRYNVARNCFDPKYYYKISDRKIFHFRPHAANAKDLTPNPNGGMVKKYSYWINRDYIARIIEEA